MATSRPPFSLIFVLANIERHMFARGEPWLLMMKIQRPGGDLSTQREDEANRELSRLGLVETEMRFARNPDPISYDDGMGSGSQVYQPFSFEMGELKVCSD